MNKDNIKKKITTAVNHVMNNPVPYAIIATAATCAVIETVYFQTHNLVDLDKAAKQMKKSGMGLAFVNKKDGRVILMKLANIKNLVQD